MIRIIMTCLCFLFLSTELCAVEPERETVWPLPLIEMREVLGGWFLSNNFSIEELIHSKQQMQFQATRGKEQWKIFLTPSSSLATRVKTNLKANGRESVLLNQLWEYLAVYTGTVKESDGNNVFRGGPAAVQQRKTSMVLLRTRGEDGEFQSTGFFIGPYGVILSTAHDLTDHSVIRAITADGKSHAVRMLKRDEAVDLAIMKVDAVSVPFISLSDLRFDIHKKEQLFAVGNPLGVHGIVASGTVFDGMRVVNGALLWQLEMSVYPGSSGSPVFGADGKLVGVVKGRHRTIPAITFMIPAETVDHFLRGGMR